MTEAEWLACPDPQAMLAFMESGASDRKFRLLLVAFWRRRFDSLQTFTAYQHELTQAEQMADGQWMPKRGQAGWIGLQRTHTTQRSGR
jgi:hypothetical protein